MKNINNEPILFTSDKNVKSWCAKCLTRTVPDLRHAFDWNVVYLKVSPRWDYPYSTSAKSDPIFRSNLRDDWSLMNHQKEMFLFISENTKFGYQKVTGTICKTTCRSSKTICKTTCKSSKTICKTTCKTLY